MAGSTLPERVAQIYYTYGLICSSYPVTAITLTLSIVLLCCYPLLNVPLPGNIPTVVTLPLEVTNLDPLSKVDCNSNKCLQEPLSHLDILYNETQKLPYIWAKEKPLLYVQQIIMKIGVSPWNNIKTTLLQHCYQIGGIKRRDSKASVNRVLPEYSCLLLSPANLWQQNLQTFALDASIIASVYSYQNLQKGKTSIAEMAFGMHLRETGIKRYP
ncbi:unnamed protein product [Arctia plantaginis]|uniref:SCAP N-terminal domain-containing protein n=1 Tax=Arctia plantaginis TaxID=874455 RepID=A0A8S1BE49_ARCPL|nr:unnamed protein product [Arctia plantaginis]